MVAVELLKVHDLHRSPRRGVARTEPVVVYLLARGEVVGMTGVEGSVRAAEDVDVGHRRPFDSLRSLRAFASVA